MKISEENWVVLVIKATILLEEWRILSFSDGCYSDELRTLGLIVYQV
jgi:hypothetical protein